MSIHPKHLVTWYVFRSDSEWSAARAITWPVASDRTRLTVDICG